MNKTNPRKIPRTQVDVERAEEQGRAFGMEFVTSLVLWILLDKHDAPPEDVQQLNNELRGLLEEISEGYVSYADIRHALRTEYDMEVEFN